MNSLASQFYQGKETRFFNTLILNEDSDSNYEELCKQTLDLPRSWYELSRISVTDRIEFTRDFWLDRIPYHPRAHPMIYQFFERLDDIIVILVQKMKEGPFEAELIYSLADNSSFFRGKPPCVEGEVEDTLGELKIGLPRDFLSFVRIHNGFGKLSEMGILEISEILEAKKRVFEMFIKTDQTIKSGNHRVDPGSLIPFFEVLGLSSFQCFNTEWYPGGEMGNVFLSGVDYTVSDLTDRTFWAENLAFVSFSEWLAQYLEGTYLCT